MRNESYYKVNLKTINLIKLLSYLLLQATHQTTIMLKEEEKLNSPTVNQSSEEMLIIEEDPPIYNTVGYVIFFFHINHIKHFTYYLLSSRKKVESDKPISVISSQQARTGSTSTDVTYASQYVYSLNIY